MKYIMAHELPSDIPGKTWKQKNMDINHKIPLWSLVEVESGARMFVCKHTRDCDGTPLYALTWDKEYFDYFKNNKFVSVSAGSYSEESLKVIHTTKEMER